MTPARRRAAQASLPAAQASPPAAQASRGRKIVSGRFAETRAYVGYLAALFHTGRTVPVFFETRPIQVDLTGFETPELQLLIEEGRRQLDRQTMQMRQNQSRASTLLTVALAECIFLAGLWNSAREWGGVSALCWAFGALFATFALGGAVSVLVAKAEYGYVNPPQEVTTPNSAHRDIAQAYFRAAPVGEDTNAARLTILHNGVWFATLAGIAILFMALLGNAGAKDDRSTPARPSNSATAADGGRPRRGRHRGFLCTRAPHVGRHMAVHARGMVSAAWPGEHPPTAADLTGGAA